MMRGDYTNGFLAHFGLKCSTWTSVNAGTSSRSACSSVGNCNHPSVREGNCLGSRSFVSIASKLYTQLCSTLPPTESYFFWSDAIHLKKETNHHMFMHFIAFLRMILLMMVVVCLNGCITLEQPYSSFFEFYPRFRELVCLLQKWGGPDAVS